MRFYQYGKEGSSTASQCIIMFARPPSGGLGTLLSQICDPNTATAAGQDMLLSARSAASVAVSLPNTARQREQVQHLEAALQHSSDEVLDLLAALDTAAGTAGEGSNAVAQAQQRLAGAHDSMQVAAGRWQLAATAAEGLKEQHATIRQQVRSVDVMHHVCWHVVVAAPAALLLAQACRLTVAAAAAAAAAAPWSVSPLCPAIAAACLPVSVSCRSRSSSRRLMVPRTAWRQPWGRSRQRSANWHGAWVCVGGLLLPLSFAATPAGWPPALARG